MINFSPLVGIIMGSDSDLPTMQAAIAVFVGSGFSDIVFFAEHWSKLRLRL